VRNVNIINKKEFKIFLTFLIIYLCFARFQYFDDDVKLDLTRAIVDEHRFEIDSYVENTGGDRAYYKGHYYSDKAPGSSFLTIPVYAIFKLFFGIPDTEFKLYLLEFLIVAFSSVLFSALLVVLMYKISRFFVKKEFHRNITTLFFSLGTMIFVYATIYYQHAVSTFFAFLCFYLLFKMQKEKKSNYYFLAGLSAGMAFITDYITITIIIPCFIFIFLKKEWKKFLLFSIGFLIFVFVLLIYNNSVFGNPLTLSYYYGDQAPYDNRVDKYDEDSIKLWKKNNETIEHIDFESLFKNNHFICAYALTYVNSPSEKHAEIRIGRSGDLKIWLNNKLIIEERGTKEAIINQNIKAVILNVGWNKILVKECKYFDNRFEFLFVITKKGGEIFNNLEYNALINNPSFLERNKEYNKSRWLVIGPFDYIDDSYNLNRKSVFPKVKDKVNPPEYEIILNNSYYGKEELVEWQILPNNKQKDKEIYFKQGRALLNLKNSFKNLQYYSGTLIRLLFYPYRGLFFYNPILILSLIGLFFMYKKNKNIVIFILISFTILCLLINLSTGMWWQGSSFGPRLLLLLIPFLTLPLMLVIKKLNKKILLIILFLCISINLLGMQEFEQSITVSKWGRANSIGEVIRNTMTEYQDEMYSTFRKPPLHLLHAPIFQVWSAQHPNRRYAWLQAGSFP